VGVTNEPLTNQTKPNQSNNIAQPTNVNMTDRVLGTPKETTWPGVTAYSNFKKTFPKWKSKPLSSVVKGLDALGLDLMQVCCCYC